MILSLEGRGAFLEQRVCRCVPPRESPRMGPNVCGGWVGGARGSDVPLGCGTGHSRDARECVTRSAPKGALDSIRATCSRPR